jgi:hypothetical protein
VPISGKGLSLFLFLAYIFLWLLFYFDLVILVLVCWRLGSGAVLKPSQVQLASEDYLGCSCEISVLHVFPLQLCESVPPTTTRAVPNSVHTSLFGRAVLFTRCCRSHVTTDGQSVSMSRCRAHSGICDQMLLSACRMLSESCCLVSVGRPLWREVGSVVCYSKSLVIYHYLDQEAQQFIYIIYKASFSSGSVQQIMLYQLLLAQTTIVV